jgi:hypothetical protein
MNEAERRRELRRLKEHVLAEHPLAVVHENQWASLNMLRSWHEQRHAQELGPGPR